MKVDRFSRVWGALLAASLCLPVLASAADDEALPARTLSEYTPGQLISGEAVDFKKMEGKVVAIEWWGTR